MRKKSVRRGQPAGDSRRTGQRHHGSRQARARRAPRGRPARRRAFRSVVDLVGRAGGYACRIELAHNTGRQLDAIEGMVRHQPSAAGPRHKPMRPTDRTTVAKALAALGHVYRLAVLERLLGGASSYAELCRHTGLQSGPLYHHVDQLRLAGLVRPKQRNVYEITRGGRNLLLVALASVRLAKDRRRCPTG